MASPLGLARTLPSALSPFQSTLAPALHAVLLRASLHWRESLSLARRHGPPGSLRDPADL